MSDARTQGLWYARRTAPFAILALSACSAFFPERGPPAAAAPDRYAAARTPAELPPADGVAQHIDAAAPPGEWWKRYESAALDALVDEGLAHSPSLAAARGSMRAAREALRAQTGQAFLPSVDAGFDPTRERTLGLPIFPQPTYLANIFAGEVQAAYTFDFFGASTLANRALARQVDRQACELIAARRALATNIVVAAINAASLQAQLAATEHLVALTEQQAELTAARRRLGSVSNDDALAADAAAANAAAAPPALRAQLLAVRHALAVLLGRTPDRAPEALALDTLHLPGNIPVAVPSELLHQRPDIQAAEAAVRAAADQAGASQAGIFPSLTLSAAYGRGAFDWSTFHSPAGIIWSVGAGLTEPLFHGGAIRARAREYAAQYDSAVAQYRQTVLGAFENVADTLVALEEDANTLAQTDRAAQAAAAAARDAEARYRLGALPWAARLAAAGQADGAEVQYLRARAARLADTAALFDSMGEPPKSPGAASSTEPRQ